MITTSLDAKAFALTGLSMAGYTARGRWPTAAGLSAAETHSTGLLRARQHWGALGVGGDPSWKEGLPFLSSSVAGWWADMFTGGD